MIKNFIIATTFMASSAIADTTVVNTGSDSGGFNAVMSMVADSLGTNVVQAGNPVIASSYFDGGDVVTMWSTEWPADDTLPQPTIDGDTIVALQVYETILCSREYTSLADLNGETVKVATWGASAPVSKFLSDYSAIESRVSLLDGAIIASWIIETTCYRLIHSKDQV